MRSIYRALKMPLPSRRHSIYVPPATARFRFTVITRLCLGQIFIVRVNRNILPFIRCTMIIYVCQRDTIIKCIIINIRHESGYFHTCQRITKSKRIPTNTRQRIPQLHVSQELATIKRAIANTCHRIRNRKRSVRFPNGILYQRFAVFAV